MPNPTLSELVTNLSTFNYYSGKGNFTKNKVGDFNHVPIEEVLALQYLEKKSANYLSKLFNPSQSYGGPKPDYKGAGNADNSIEGSVGTSNILDLLTAMTLGGNKTFPKLQKGDVYKSEKDLYSFKNNDGILGFLDSTTTVKSYASTFAAKDASATSEANVVVIPEEDILNIDPDTSILSTPSTKGVPFDFSIQDFRAYKKIINPNAFPDYVPNVGPGIVNGAYKGTRIVLDTAENARKYNIYNRLGIINTNNQDGFGTVYQDRLNALSLYYGGGANGLRNELSDMNGYNVTKDTIRDLIKFRIKAIDNDHIGSGVFMVFRAFLNGAITDSITPTWNPIKYTGRGESFYSYDGVTSTISFSFTIAALSRQEMKPLYQKLTYLKSIMYPDYKANKMRGTVIELTIGDYIKYQPGIINSLSITIPENTQWEIALNSPDLENKNKSLDDDMHELPMMLKVDMEFIPIWNFLPQKSKVSSNEAKLTPFIGIDKSINDRNNEWSYSSTLEENGKPKYTTPPNDSKAIAPQVNTSTSGNNTQGK